MNLDQNGPEYVVHLHRAQHDVVHVGDDLHEQPVFVIEEHVHQFAQAVVLARLDGDDHLLDVVVLDDGGELFQITQQRELFGQQGGAFAP